MARTPRITAEMLLEAGAAITLEKGADALNVRSVAAKLNCSVQPVFRNFGSMETFRRAVIEYLDGTYQSFVAQYLDKSDYLFTISLAHILLVALFAKKWGLPKSEVHYTKKEVVQIVLRSLGALFMVILVLGGILSGAFTATEASAIAVIYVLVLDLIMSRKLTRQQLWEALKTTASSSATIYLIIGFTSIIGWILAVENVPAMIQGWVYSSNISPYLLFFLFNVFILFNGMWISDSAQMVLYAPLFTPIFVSMGCSAIHVGVVMVVNVMIGMITPPFGMAL